MAMADGDMASSSLLLSKACCADAPDVIIEPIKEIAPSVSKGAGKMEYLFFESAYFRQLYAEKGMVLVNPTNKLLLKMKRLNIHIAVYLTQEQDNVAEREKETVDYLRYIGHDIAVNTINRRALSELHEIKYLQFQNTYMDIVGDDVVCFEINPYSPQAIDRGIYNIREDGNTVTFTFDHFKDNVYFKNTARYRVSTNFLKTVWGPLDDMYNLYLPQPIDNLGNMTSKISIRHVVEVVTTPCYELLTLDVDVRNIIDGHFFGRDLHYVQDGDIKILVRFVTARAVYDQMRHMREFCYRHRDDGFRFLWSKKKSGGIHCYPGSGLLVAPFDDLIDGLAYGCKTRFTRVELPTNEVPDKVQQKQKDIMLPSKTLSGKDCKKKVTIHYERWLYAGVFGYREYREGKMIGQTHFYKHDVNGEYIFRMMNVSFPGAIINSLGECLISPTPLFGLQDNGSLKNASKNLTVVYDLPFQSAVHELRFDDSSMIQQTLEGKRRMVMSRLREVLQKSDHRDYVKHHIGDYSRYLDNIDVEQLQKQFNVHLMFSNGSIYVSSKRKGEPDFSLEPPLAQKLIPNG